ncbi:autophagy-related protein [Pseudozyma hubeiensis SY62]|uniref:Autophagy-related protein n=1 Tax=Pseudozyma hubeiensis (strain SY62) TaxID=1305764 RepID=R9NY20_PSEHS|nr:autophagy-related protein [Pseudozyma hubeiensis SY62]GAC93643.1 autophagy-related protein [Pseudozyma hubeiensis SY62]
MAPSPSHSYVENPRTYNNLASAYSKRNGTATTATSSRTALGSDDAVQKAYASRDSSQRMPSHSGPSAPMPGVQSRVYGLTADLREQSTPTAANSPALDDATRMARLLNEQKPNFSVEVFASSFDNRGYPVISGRAATVRGIVRMPAATGCDVMMTISAHTTSGSPAAVWQGIALAPYSAGGEKTVFEIKDRLVANYDLVKPRAAYAPKNEEMMEPPQLSKDDLVLPIPFQVQLPLGKSTRFIDGEMQAVPVSLPPSFEISSKHAAQERRDIRLATKGKAKVPMAKELLEKGFSKVYRIGCYYQVTWTLIRSSKEKSKKSSSKSAKEPAEGDSLTLPFIFMGEPTSMPPHPPTLPSTISPDVFLEQDVTLGDQWSVHRSQAKWSGSLLKASRKTVDVEMHLPNPPVLQAPSVLPVMVVLRPTDPTLLMQVRTRAPSETSTAPGSPAVAQVEDPIEMMSSPTATSRASTVAASPPLQQQSYYRPSQQKDADTESIKTTRSIMSRFIKPSTSLARLQASPSRRGGSSIFSGRRPNTAPSSGSSDTGFTDAMTDRTFVTAGALPDLVSLVCVSLIQTTFSSNDNINDGPEHRRKLLSVADLEEVDVHALLVNSDSSGSQGGSRPGSSRSPEEMTQINEAVSAARAAGVRVLVGNLKVAGATPPSFRCHGLEVKYALKVDLLPANRYGGSEGVEKAMKSLGLGGRSRGFSDGSSTTASMHTQTQFTSLSGGSSPPTTPPNVMSPSLFGGRSPPEGPANRASPMQNVGMAISTTDESAVPAEEVNRAPYPSAFPTHQYLQQQPGRATPSTYSAASTRTGWGGSGYSEASGMQSSIYMSEWGRDRKTVSKINKTIGEMWLDIRVVRGYGAY